MRTTTSSGHFARLSVVIISAVALLLGGMIPGVQAGEPGASTCTFTGGEVLVDLQEDDSSGTLSRNAAGVIFYDDESEPPTPPAPCGPATTATTTSIKVVDTSDDGSTGIILDLTEGHFANGANEIPIEIDLALGTLDVFGVIGGGAEDFWTFGFEKANLQKDDEAELEFVKPPDFGFGATAGANDKACSNGGRGTGGPSQVGWVFSGGLGADTLCGGRSTDRILGQGGDDTVKGNGGGDTVRGGAGDDRVAGNSSSDLLFGNKGADGLNGGPGFDGCDGGAGGDMKKRCET